jgi:hypothetical protein
MRRSEYWKERRPGYFFYFERPDLFPGFADCMPNYAAGIEGGSRASADCMSVLLNRLADNYPMVLHNDIVRVFDLGGAKKLELTPSYHEYPREESGDRWWYWVRDRISFAVVDTSDIARQRSVSFDYSLLADQHLSVIIVGEHDQLRRDLTQSGSGEQHFNLVLPASLGRLESIDMSGEGAGQGLRLSASDARTARFQLSDLEVMVVGAESPPK